MDRFQNKYRIPSARANWHGYDGGVYFVTICTQNRVHYFGKIENGEMHLSPIGQYAHEQFANVKTHYPYAEIPLFVVMPNHIHAVVVIDGKNETACSRDVACNVSTGETNNPFKNIQMANISPKNNTLATVIRGIKSSITKFVNTNNIPFAWQSRFHDHIVRNQDELNRIATYIENNVAQWHLDTFNKTL